MSDYKLHSTIRKNNQKRIAIDVWNKEKAKNIKKFDKYDQKIFDQGMEWFESGLSLEDAPEDIRNNTNFINGFNKGSRLAEINNSIYNDGKNFFFSGFALSEASEKMKNNPYFIKGYNDASNLDKVDDAANNHKR